MGTVTEKACAGHRKWLAGIALSILAGCAALFLLPMASANRAEDKVDRVVTKVNDMGETVAKQGHDAKSHLKVRELRDKALMVEIRRNQDSLERIEEHLNTTPLTGGD